MKIYSAEAESCGLALRVRTVPEISVSETPVTESMPCLLLTSLT